MLFPEAEVTRSLSNMIKAYSVRYKEEMKKIDVGQREEQIHAKVAEAVLAGAFVGGLSAVSLTEGSEIPAIADFSGEEGAETEEGTGSDIPAEDPTTRALRALKNEAALEAWREEERQKIKAEITGAEKLAIKIEMEKAIRTQADVILEQARAQGEQVKAKARQDAENEKNEIFEAARREGYEAGKQRLLEEQEAWSAACEEQERRLAEAYESKARELEPQATEVVVKLLESLTGVCLESRKGIVTHLVTKALNEADRSNSYLIKVSKEDLEEVKAASERLRSLFEREVVLEVVQDVLLKKGECMIETDSNIIDCSLGTQLEGLIQDIRLLSVQERM
mgnify:CR=1 FL=1